MSPMTHNKLMTPKFFKT